MEDDLVKWFFEAEAFLRQAATINPDYNSACYIAALEDSHIHLNRVSYYAKTYKIELPGFVRYVIRSRNPLGKLAQLRGIDLAAIQAHIRTLQVAETLLGEV